MLGVEPPSVADVNNLPEVTKIHEILLGGGITIIEGLCNLDQIKAEFVTLIALPIKYKNGDGAPARVVAIENWKV
jgi:kynurenine formamidase